MLGLLAGWVDAGISTWLPGEWTAVRASLPLVLALAMFSSRERALTAAVACGLVLDALLPSFGLVTLRLLLVAAVIHALSARFFTSRSLIGASTLALAGLALDRAALFIITVARGFVGTPFIPETHAGLWAQAGWVVCSVGSTFLLFASFTRRFFPSVTRR